MSLISWSVLVLLWSVGPGSGCSPVCSGSHCLVVLQGGLDFPSAEQACRGRRGELLTLHSDTDQSLLDALRLDLRGGFWIGLRLPAGCSDPSAPLRGYRWSSGGEAGPLPSCSWAQSISVCSPSCVSLSQERRLSERPCSHTADGALCRVRHQDACRAHGLSEPVFKSSRGCEHSPCEHLCTAVTGGYTCSCFKGYLPDSSDPKRCKLHCSQQKCAAVCQTHSGGVPECFCPDGYLRTDKLCVDIDECAMKWCGQLCKNTYGGYTCSCEEGFVLKDKDKCIRKAEGDGPAVTTPVAVGSANNRTRTASPAAAGHFLWPWIVLALAVVAFVVVFRLYVVKRQRGREENLSQDPPVPADNAQC